MLGLVILVPYLGGSSLQRDYCLQRRTLSSSISLCPPRTIARLAAVFFSRLGRCVGAVHPKCIALTSRLSGPVP